MTPDEGPMPAPGPIYSSQRASPQRNRVLLVLLLALGTFMLVYKFPAVPVGLHQDEMSEAYEAYSLLHTGADRWGYHLPVYFLSWGSGQNVLQSYLTVPVVAVLGLTRVSARLVPLLCGLATLPLFFYTLRRWFGETTALLGLLFLALSPWHIMMSRWGIENSPLPFFMLLGVFTFGRALQSASPWRVLPAFVPLALALYAYGVVVVIIPLLVPLLLLVDVAAIRRQWRLWLGAVGMFCLVALPIAFYTFKNYVTKTNYAFERWLPFSVPLLPVTRLAEVSNEKLAPTVIGHNLHFLRRGLVDDTLWFQVPGNPPLQRIVFYLALLGVVVQGWRLVSRKGFSEPFLPWLIACVPASFMIPFNISRGMALFVPLLAMAGFGLAWLCQPLRKPAYQLAAGVVFAMLFVPPTVRFARAYYGRSHASLLASTLYPELPATLDKVQRMAGEAMPIYVTESISINHVQVLFLDRIDPAVFQRSGATYNHPDFGRWRFSRASLASTPTPFAYLIKATEPVPCAAGRPAASGQFLIGICP